MLTVSPGTIAPCILRIDMLDFFKGPLGSHRNYLTHIALPNSVDYMALAKGHEETQNASTSAKYKELRYFLNAVESLNNILEYYFYENETTISEPTVQDFKQSVYSAHPELQDLAKLANAYKHCVRERNGRKRTNVPWAKNLQIPDVRVYIDLSQRPKVKVDADYMFQGPTSQHLEVFHKAVKFWFSYHNDPRATLSQVAKATP
jgi:hypothetical protein